MTHIRIPSFFKNFLFSFPFNYFKEFGVFAQQKGFLEEVARGSLKKANELVHESGG